MVRKVPSRSSPGLTLKINNEEFQFHGYWGRAPEIFGMVSDAAVIWNSWHVSRASKRNSGPKDLYNHILQIDWEESNTEKNWAGWFVQFLRDADRHLLPSAEQPISFLKAQVKYTLAPGRGTSSDDGKKKDVYRRNLSVLM